MKKLIINTLFLFFSVQALAFSLLTGAEGGVRILGKNAETSRKVRPGQSIIYGEYLVTQSGSRARVASQNGDFIIIGPDSSVKIESAQEVRLVSGMMRSVIDHNGPHQGLRVTTAEIDIQIQGTDFFVEYNPDSKSATVQVLRGAVEVTQNKIATQVQSGELARFSVSSEVKKLRYTEQDLVKPHSLLSFDNSKSYVEDSASAQIADINKKSKALVLRDLKKYISQVDEKKADDFEALNKISVVQPEILSSESGLPHSQEVQYSRQIHGSEFLFRPSVGQMSLDLTTTYYSSNSRVGVAYTGQSMGPYVQLKFAYGFNENFALRVGEEYVSLNYLSSYSGSASISNLSGMGAPTFEFLFKIKGEGQHFYIDGTYQQSLGSGSLSNYDPGGSKFTAFLSYEKTCHDCFWGAKLTSDLYLTDQTAYGSIYQNKNTQYGLTLFYESVLSGFARWGVSYQNLITNATQYKSGPMSSVPLAASSQNTVQLSVITHLSKNWTFISLLKVDDYFRYPATYNPTTFATTIQAGFNTRYMF